MTDPKRWLDEGGGASAGERELLEAGRNAKLPSALRERVWLGVAAGAVGVAAAGEAAGAASTIVARKGIFSLVAGSTWGKGVVAVALLGGASLGVSAIGSRHAHRDPPMNVAPASREALGAPTAFTEESATPSPRADETLPQVETARSPSDAPPTSPPLGAKSRTAAAPRVAPSSPAAARAASDPEEAREIARDTPPASRLREESAAVLAIRKTLLAGDASRALQMLEGARVAFPNGMLVEEREALAVRALVASGQRELAQKRGEAFLRTFPRSPHASDVRAAIGR